MKKKLGILLILVIMFSNSVPVAASEIIETETDKVYIERIFEELQKNGEFEGEEILLIEVKPLQSVETGSLSRSIDKKQNTDAIKIVTEDMEGINEVFVIPFIYNENGVENVTRSDILQEKQFEYSDLIYVMVSAKYYYYSIYETDFYGPFYKPSLVKAKWLNGSSSCSVSSMNVNFNNAGYICNITNGSHNGSLYQKNSVININNPTQGNTYIGTNIIMDNNTGFSMLFNGIETYSYIYSTISFTADGKSYTRHLNASTFSDSGLAEG